MPPPDLESRTALLSQETDGETPVNRKVSPLQKGRDWITWYLTYTLTKYQKAPIAGKAFVWFLIFAHILLAYLLIVYGPSQIAQTLYNWSQELKKLKYGWLILISIIAITSFPPLVGWSTSVSVCGFAYGLKGWFVAAAGAIIGAAMTFLVLRYFFKKKIRSWTQHNAKWQALEAVIRARGLPLIILIRLCPLPPWVYANTMFASIETVSFFQFMVATVVYTPRLMFAVWIGSRVAMLSDGEQRGEMDTAAKIVNAISILLGFCIAIGTGWLVWRLTEQQIKKTTGVSPEEDQLAAEALEAAATDLDEPLARAPSFDFYDDVEGGYQLDDEEAHTNRAASKPNGKPVNTFERYRDDD
ncbi:Tlg2-vesicle protein [Tulasnella sp. 419]|nr:Tlg2-vesicle protein [Tulasnella sp. 419]